MSDDLQTAPAARSSRNPIEREDDWEVVAPGDAVRVSPHLGAMISVRLDADDARLVRGAAQRAGLSQAEFVRRAAVDAARSAAPRQPVAAGAGNG